MKYEVIEHLTYVYSVVVEANNIEDANQKAFEGGEMSKHGEQIDIYTANIETNEVTQCIR